MFGQYFKHILVLTLLAGLTYSLPQVKDAMAGAFDISYAGASSYTAAAGDLSRGIVWPPVSIKEITGKVVYDSKHQESSINITAKIQITAKDADVGISDSSFYFTLRNKVLNIDGASVISSSVVSNLTKDSNGYYMVKKGSTALFSVTASANPKSMIAGQYYANLTTVITSTGKIQIPANSSNTFVVVGEASPFITLAGQGLYGSKDTLVLNAVRLGRSPSISFKSMYDICPAGQVCVPSSPKTFSLKGSYNSKQINFNLSGKDIPAGQYYVYVTNNELGSSAGKSNSVPIQILDQSKILTAQAIAGKLALTYDAQNQEASLAAQFEVIIKAGNESLTFDSNSFYVSGASQTVLKSVNGQVNMSPTYTLPAGKEARLLILASNNPKIMFAGQYSMSVKGIYPSTVNGNKVYVQVGENQTNTVTIIGEVSPYINSVTPNPVVVGNLMTINGARLTNAIIFIDGTERDPIVPAVTPSNDDTHISFTAPSLENGYHMLYVKNANGQSNNMWFESVGGPVVPPICPPGYTCSIPVISSITPQSGPSGTLITIIGSGFLSDSRIHYSDPLGGTIDSMATSISADGTNITEEIPHGPMGADLMSGEYQIYVSSGLLQSNTHNFTVSNSAASIVTRIDPMSPVDRVIQISNSAVTANVVLGVFDLKSQGSNSILRNLKLNMDAYGPFSGNSPDTLFTNIKIKVGDLTYLKSSLGPTPVGENGVKVNFSDLNIPLPADVNIPVTVMGDVGINTNNSLSSSTARIYLYPNQINIVAEDTSYNPVTVIPSTGALTSSKAYFISGPITPPSLPFIQVLTPNGGEALVKGNHYQITWYSNIATSSTVHIGIKRCPSCYDDINFDAPNTGSYDWTVGITPFYPPVDQPGYQIKIVGGDYRGSADDVSDGYFSISTSTVSTRQAPVTIPITR